MTTIRDVAKAAKCSPATVSLVINGSTRQVSRGTRSRVLETVRDLGYRPTAGKSAKSRLKMRTIGVLYEAPPWYSQSDLYFRPIVDGLFHSVQMHGYSILFFGQIKWTNVLSNLRQYIDGRCDGLVLVAPHVASSFISTVKARGIPVAVLGTCSQDSGVSSVVVDDTAGAIMAVQYLYKNGHRRIAFFEGDHDNETAAGRLAGFKAGCRDLGLGEDECPIFLGDYCWESGFARAQAIASEIPQGDCPTAVFCCGDAVALGALAGFAASGVVVPDQISVIGFDDLPESSCSDPPLTTVAQPLVEMGAQVCDIAVQEIESPGCDAVKIVRQPSVVERRSVMKIVSGSGQRPSFSERKTI